MSLINTIMAFMLSPPPTAPSTVISLRAGFANRYLGYDSSELETAEEIQRLAIV